MLSQKEMNTVLFLHVKLGLSRSTIFCCCCFCFFIYLFIPFFFLFRCFYFLTILIRSVLSWFKESFDFHFWNQLATSWQKHRNIYNFAHKSSVSLVLRTSCDSTVIVLISKIGMSLGYSDCAVGVNIGTVLLRRHFRVQYNCDCPV